MTTTTQFTAQDLAHFTGTENWYRLPLACMLYTDGVKYLAEQAGAYWLIDAVAFGQEEPGVKGQPFQVWTLAVRENSAATLTCTDGNAKILYQQHISFTDFPLPEITLWVEDRVILLPSEH